MTAWLSCNACRRRITDEPDVTVSLAAGAAGGGDDRHYCDATDCGPAVRRMLQVVERPARLRAISERARSLTL